MNELNEFVKQEARPLPVVLLLDVSGSMGGSPIISLNQAVREMISTFANEDDIRAEIHVSVITFGDVAKLYTPLSPAKSIMWQDMNAAGMTPLGGALEIAKNLIEDKSIITGRAYRPTVILVSDGSPNDAGWEIKMQTFINDGRSQKADRMALAIGAHADENMLRDFLNDPEKIVYHAEDASKIKQFFKFVTMSVTTKSKSTNPNLAVKLPSSLDDPFGDL